MGQLHQLDIILIIGYLVGMMALGVVLGRRQKTDQDYFLGGRKLRWWMVGISMVVSDIGALELVGVAGTAYSVGMSVANFEWIGCVPAMIVAAFVFIPFYWRARVFTVPEYLGRRYNDGVRAIVAVLWGLFMVANLGIFLYAASLTLERLVGWPTHISLLVTAFVVGFYTFTGGLRAVVITDTISMLHLGLGQHLNCRCWFQPGRRSARPTTDLAIKRRHREYVTVCVLGPHNRAHAGNDFRMLGCHVTRFTDVLAEIE